MLEWLLLLGALSFWRELQSVKNVVESPLAHVAVVRTEAEPSDYIWIEGEEGEKNEVTSNLEYDLVDKPKLSGREWLHHVGTKVGRARYHFVIDERAMYEVWWRGNLRGVAHFSLDADKSTRIPVEQAVDRLNIAERGDIRELGWVKLKEVLLNKGSHSLVFELGGAPLYHGGIDCLCITHVPFKPEGLSRPYKILDNDNLWFPVYPERDTFSSNSITDRSFELDIPAGSRGCIQPRKDILITKGDGEEIKLWGVQFDLPLDWRESDMRWMARWLAKHGVNLVRQDSLEFLKDKTGELDAYQLERFDRWFNTLKTQGIYMGWSLLSPLILSETDAYPGDLKEELPENVHGQKQADALLLLSSRLIDIKIAGMVSLMNRVNTFTGLRYADDPALAFIELHRDVNLFWYHPIDDLKQGHFPKHKNSFQRMWTQWLLTQYQSEAKLTEAWGPLRIGESLTGSSMEFDGIRGMARTSLDSIDQRRHEDFLKFLCELQAGALHQQMQRMREIGYAGLIFDTSSRSAGKGVEWAQLYCDSLADAISRSFLAGGGAGGDRVIPGIIQTQSQLKNPEHSVLNINRHKVENKVFACLDWASFSPFPWRAEMAPLVAGYGMGYQGWNIACLRLTSLAASRDAPVYPMLSLYQFPALQNMISNKHILPKEGGSRMTLRLADRFRALETVMNMPGDEQSLRKGALYDIPTSWMARQHTAVRFSEGISRYEFPSANDDDREPAPLAWDMQKGCLKIQSTTTQGVVGWTENHWVELPVMDLRTSSPFISFLATALDGQSLAESDRILLTVLSTAKLSGSRMTEAGDRLLSVGQAPLLLKHVPFELRFKGRGSRKLKVLDTYGVPDGRVVKSFAEAHWKLEDSMDTCYYLMTLP